MIHEISNKTVKKFRHSKEEVNPNRPYLFLHEKEMQNDGRVHDVNTIFLTNRECPFKCVMCDLWRHTLDQPTPAGAIPKQIRYALDRLPSADIIKLYNSGNFFDGKAIPLNEYEEIAELLSDYEHIIVENHPKLIGSFMLEFRNMLNGSLEIAMGLETIHPEVLPKLNKQISKEDFFESTQLLIQQGIDVRAFILLNPPFLTNQQKNIEWSLKSVQFAFDCGCDACTIIPVRDGNGIMEQLRKSGEYVPPTLSALETAFKKALYLEEGRVFCDLWDLKRFSECEDCFEDRKKRINEMNLTQVILPDIHCHCNSPSTTS